jgi:DNA-binding winged helix-turn-helix (wHTH) protein
MNENPFFHRGPIRDPAYFYNRKKETRRTLEMLGNGQSVSITGPRKIGKTSLLFHLSRPDVMQESGLDPARYLVVYFTGEAMAGLELEEFYALILEGVAAKAIQQQHHFTVPERPVSYQDFERAFHQILERGLKLALLLDEFELLGGNPKFGIELLSGLRALATKYGIAYLTVSQSALSIFTEHHSPFFNIFFSLQLGFFDEPDSLELIEGSLVKAKANFRPETIAHVLELGGRHPFFLQVASYCALELQTAKGSPLESKDFQRLDQIIRDQADSHLEYYWRHLTPEQQYVLAALPFTQGEEMHQEHLQSLACLCLIIKENSHYGYFSPLLRDFVCRQKVRNILRAGRFVLSLPHQCVLLEEKLLPVTSRQFALLSYLVARQGQVVSNEELDREVISSFPEETQCEYLGDERLKSAIKGLRRALGNEATCIVNKRGVGYMFHLPAK